MRTLGRGTQALGLYYVQMLRDGTIKANRMLTGKADRKTLWNLGEEVIWKRTKESIQQQIAVAPKAKRCFSYGFEEYAWFRYHAGRHEVSVSNNVTLAKSLGRH